jgi:hypothetical protein
MDNIEQSNTGLIELDMWDERFGDLQREFNRAEEAKESEFRAFIESSLPIHEQGEHGAAEACFTDYHNAEGFAEIAHEAGFKTQLIESGKSAVKPYTKVRIVRSSLGDFLASRGYKKKTD